MCYYLLYYVILEKTCIRKCLYVCLLVIHFNLWIHPFQFMDSSISIYGFIHFNLWIHPFQFMDSSISIYGFIHFNLWIQSSDYLYVVLPLITSGKRRCAKLNFKLPRTIFQIFDLEVLFWTSLSHIWVKLFLN